MGKRRKNVTPKQKEEVLELLDEGRPVEAVARLTRLSRSTVYKIRGEARKGVVKRLTYEQHFELLSQAANQLRRCLYNPRLELEPYIATGQPLRLRSHDWALLPDEWVELTTPDLDDEALWGDMFPLLREHLAKSPFWDHLKELAGMARELGNVQERAAEQFGSQAPGLGEAWENFRRARGWRPRQSRTPLTPEPDWDTTRPPYTERFAARVCEAFSEGRIPDLYQRLWALVEKLAQLNEDLAPDTVNLLLVGGTCSHCESPV